MLKIFSSSHIGTYKSKIFKPDVSPKYCIIQLAKIAFSQQLCLNNARFIKYAVSTCIFQQNVRKYR